MSRQLLGQDDFAQHVAQAKRQGQRVVMTNGCFDLLHPGHLHYLERAAALGDRLAVALNSDTSVALLKGPGRPVCPLQDRAAMLLGLRWVDWVTSFDEQTPADLIARCQPHVLVKGGDYSGKDIPGSAAVLASGGQVRTLEFLEGYSTSALLLRLATARE